MENINNSRWRFAKAKEKKRAKRLDNIWPLPNTPKLPIPSSTQVPNFHRDARFNFPSLFSLTNPPKTLTPLTLHSDFPVEMPGVASGSGDTRGASGSNDSSLVPYSPELRQPVIYSLHHGLKPPIGRLSISWSRGNNLRVSVLRPPSAEDSDDVEVGGRVVEVRLSNGDGETGDAKWRRIAYGSVPPFALLQSRRSSVASLSKMSMSPSPYNIDW